MIGLAVAIAALALVDAGLTLVQRWFSSRIGEGLIFDLRTEVFDHVQRMPVAFFMRAQTGALVSRLNTDVIGAQRALTSTLSSVVSNVVSLVLVLGAMLVLSWQVTVVALVLLPIFIVPAKWVGRRMSALTREQMQLDAEMSSVTTERFNVAGAMVAKLYGRPEDDARMFGDRAARVRDVGVTVGMYATVFRVALGLVAALATALVYGIGGVLAVGGAFELGTLVALAALLMRLYGPLTSLSNVHVDVMTALVSFDRVFEILDLKPMVAGAARTPGRCPTGRSRSSSTTSSFRYPSAEEVSLASLESVARPDTGAVAAGAARRVVHGRARPAHRPGRPLGGGQDHDHLAGLPALRRQRGRGPDQRARRARRHPRLAARHRGRGHAGRAPLPRHDRRQPPLRPARRRARRRSGRRCGPRRSATWSRRCPTGWTPSSATAATGCPAARSSGWRWPGCC